VPLAAARSDRAAFVIAVAGWQGPAWRQDAVRVESELRAAGSPEAEVKEAVAFARRRMALIRGGGPYEELEAAQSRVEARPWFASVRWCDRALFHSARRLVEHDSGPSWEKVRCPVLAVYAGKDTSTGPPEPHVAVIRRGLGKANNTDLTVRVFPEADHSLRVGKDFAPGYLDAMTDWLGERFPSD
jgi:pimeloyl-ACP methyl ester carboxylesterase